MSLSNSLTAKSLAYSEKEERKEKQAGNGGPAPRQHPPNAPSLGLQGGELKCARPSAFPAQTQPQVGKKARAAGEGHYSIGGTLAPGNLPADKALEATSPLRGRSPLPGTFREAARNARSLGLLSSDSLKFGGRWALRLGPALASDA